MAESAIEFSRVDFRFGEGAPLLIGLDLTVQRGEFLVLVGPNGAGKSTLLRLAAGLLAVQSGTVTVAGAELGSLSSKQRARRVAFVPQALARVPAVSVERFVASGRYAHRSLFGGPTAADREALDGALDSLGLRSMRGRLLTELSGGQRQLALLARALCQESQVILVDEPTTGLDLPHQLDAFERMAQVADAGRTILAVSHELNLASQFAARVGVLWRGGLHHIGTPAEVLRPEVLGPLYGERLHFGALPSHRGQGQCPTVIPYAHTAHHEPPQ